MFDDYMDLAFVQAAQSCLWSLFPDFLFERRWSNQEDSANCIVACCYNLPRWIFVCVLNRNMNINVFACFCFVIGRLQVRTIAFSDPVEGTMSCPRIFSLRQVGPAKKMLQVCTVVARSWFRREFALVPEFLVSVYVLVTRRAHIAFSNLCATQMCFCAWAAILKSSLLFSTRK